MSLVLGAELLPLQAPFAYAEVMTDAGDLFEDEIAWEDPEETADDLIVEDDADSMPEEDAGPGEADDADPDSVMQTVPDGILQDDEASVTEAPDALFEDETETEAETEDPGPEIVMETAEISDALYVPDQIVPVEDARYGSIASAAGLRRAMRRQAAAGTTGSGFSFASQLSGEALSMYDSKTAYYAAGHHTDTWNYHPDKSVYRFEGKLVGSKYDEADQQTRQNLEAAKEAMMRDMQGAADAFKHDHPEVFWIRSPKKYDWGYSYDRSTVKEEADGTKTASFYIALISYEPVETFTGAYDLIDQYQSGVFEATAQVKGMADDLNTEGAAAGSPEYQALLVRAADQYLSERLYYDNEGLNAAVAASKEEAAGGNAAVNDAYRIYTSAAAFLNAGGALTMGVVCEGYAKALKVLCDNLGIPCVCIAGLTDRNRSGSGHMWNGVQIGGVWYLTDPTWDDTGDVSHRESSRKYLLVSNYTNNSNLTNRRANGNLNGSTLAGITVFQYPAISETCYETSHDYRTDTVAPDCENDGYNVIKCQTCGREEERSNPVPAAGHDYREASSEDATCTERGSVSFICTKCGKTKEITEEPLGHDLRVAIVAPTCEEDGYTVHTCSRCGYSYKTDRKEKLGHDDAETSRTEPTCTKEGRIVYTCRSCRRQRTETVPQLGHSYQAGDVTAPTCRTRGFTTYVCSRCGSSYQADFKPKLGHSYRKKVTAPTCTAYGFTTYTCVRDGFSYKGDYKKKLGHSYKAKVIAPTEQRKGYTLHTCSRCGKSYKDSYKEKLLKKTKLKKVRASGAGKFTVTFRRTQKYKKYEIQYAEERDFSDAVKKIVIRKNKTNQVTISAKKKKVYYVRVRVRSGSRVGAWSTVKKVRTKKR